MTRLGLRPYQRADTPAAGSVPLSVIVLTKNEAANIDRCLASVSWANQVVVLDSGSADDTVERAIAAGAEVVVDSWRGYGPQREHAMRLPGLRHDWVYFVDADEWVSTELATEVAQLLTRTDHDAYAQRRRLIFQGRWIRHCGWYRGSWMVRLMRRSRACWDGEVFGERARVTGSVGRLRHDLVDEDRKGLAAWLRKHVGYAELEASRRGIRTPLRVRWESFRTARRADTRPLARAVAKDLVFPLVPAKPLAQFCYMYLFRAGFMDGMAGLRFCLYHAWFQLTIDALRAEASQRAGSAPGLTWAGVRHERRA